MEALLGIDISTSGAKVGLFDVDGRCLAENMQEYPMAQPQNGWAEQDPHHWWDATVTCIRHVLQQTGVPSGNIRGIGLSGQMHGLVLLDRFGEVLRPSILWCDQRTAKECAQLDEIVGRQRLIDITSNPPMTGFTAAKILWVQNNEPDIWRRCAHILLPKDYIRFKLTGEFATDVSDAAGTQLLNITKRQWSGTILDLIGITKPVMGALYESPEGTGTVHKAAATATGLAEGTLVVAGAGDNAAAAVGIGVVKAGKAFTTIGSSAVVYAVSDEVCIDHKGRVHTLCGSVPGKWTLMSCTQAAGLSLRWLRDTCCAPEAQQAEAEGKNPYEIMDALAAGVPIGADKLLYLPYLMGERSPHPDPDCRGVFFGLSAIHTRANLIRAVMEGVAYSQRECVDVFHEMGVVINDMLMTGAAARSHLWRQMMADLYNCPVATIKDDLGAAKGAALLAGVGAGLYPTVEEACEACVQRDKVQKAKNHAAYQPYYQLYKKLYRDLQEDFAVLAGL